MSICRSTKSLLTNIGVLACRIIHNLQLLHHGLHSSRTRLKGWILLILSSSVKLKSLNTELFIKKLNVMVALDVINCEVV